MIKSHFQYNQINSYSVIASRVFIFNALLYWIKILSAPQKIVLQVTQLNSKLITQFSLHSVSKDNFSAAESQALIFDNLDYHQGHFFLKKQKLSAVYSFFTSDYNDWQFQNLIFEFFSLKIQRKVSLMLLDSICNMRQRFIHLLNQSPLDKEGKKLNAVRSQLIKNLQQLILKYRGIQLHSQKQIKRERPPSVQKKRNEKPKLFPPIKNENRLQQKKKEKQMQVKERITQIAEQQKIKKIIETYKQKIIKERKEIQNRILQPTLEKLDSVDPPQQLIIPKQAKQVSSIKRFKVGVKPSPLKKANSLSLNQQFNQKIQIARQNQFFQQIQNSAITIDSVKEYLPRQVQNSLILIGQNSNQKQQYQQVNQHLSNLQQSTVQVVKTYTEESETQPFDSRNFAVREISKQIYTQIPNCTH